MDIRASLRLIFNVKRRDHTLTYMYQHITIKWLSFRKRCKHRLLCLAQTTLLIRKPGYIKNLLTRRAILSHVRISDDIIVDGGPPSEVQLEAYSAIVHSSPLFLVHGIYYI